MNIPLKADQWRIFPDLSHLMAIGSGTFVPDETI
jgi:hypothetical protein